MKLSRKQRKKALVLMALIASTLFVAGITTSTAGWYQVTVKVKGVYLDYDGDVGPGDLDLIIKGSKYSLGSYEDDMICNSKQYLDNWYNPSYWKIYQECAGKYYNTPDKTKTITYSSLGQSFEIKLMDDDWRYDDTLLRLKVTVDSIGSNTGYYAFLQEHETKSTNFGSVRLVYSRGTSYGSYTTKPYYDDSTYTASGCVGVCVNTAGWQEFSVAYNNLHVYISVTWVSGDSPFY